MVRQIVVTALIASGSLWPSLAASQTATPLWPAVPECSADASTRRDDATCREATVATDSAQAEESSKPSGNDSPLVLSATYIGQAAGNPRGGVRQDIAYAGRLLVSSAVDLDRFIPGGTLHVAFCEEDCAGGLGGRRVQQRGPDGACDRRQLGGRRPCVFEITGGQQDVDGRGEHSCPGRLCPRVEQHAAD